jgi:parallel beta-helix repeat protein
MDSTVIDGQNPQFAINVTADNVVITGFTIRKGSANASAIGILIVSSGNVVSHCRVEGAYEGIFINGATDNFISDNVISGNVADGIYLYFSRKNVFSRNAILNNYEGVSFVNSQNNTFSDNMVSGSHEGFSLWSSGNNVFSGNTFMDNQIGGSISFLSSHNVFYHNNFRDNINVEPGVANVWNYGGEGNYWHDYTGQDSNKDGIGNIPYSIDPNNRDNNPLAGMFSGFDVVLSAGTYQVAVISNSTVSDFRFEIGTETGSKIIRFNVTGQEGSFGFSRISIPTRLLKSFSLVIYGGEEEINSTLLDISTSANMFLYFTYPVEFHSTQTVAIIYNDLLDKNLKLQTDLSDLNATYLALISNYTAFLGKYNQLQQNYSELNTSYNEHLAKYQEISQNFRNLTYIFAAATAVFIIATVYLSRRLHSRPPKAFEDRK